MKDGNVLYQQQQKPIEVQRCRHRRQRHRRRYKSTTIRLVAYCCCCCVVITVYILHFQSFCDAFVRPTITTQRSSRNDVDASSIIRTTTSPSGVGLASSSSSSLLSAERSHRTKPRSSVVPMLLLAVRDNNSSPPVSPPSGRGNYRRNGVRRTNPSGEESNDSKNNNSNNNTNNSNNDEDPMVGRTGLQKWIIQKRQRQMTISAATSTSSSSTTTGGVHITPPVKNDLRKPTNNNGRINSGRINEATRSTGDNAARSMNVVPKLFTYDTMLEHKILTREQEQHLVRTVRKAVLLQQQMEELIKQRETERREVLEQERQQQEDQEQHRRKQMPLEENDHYDYDDDYDDDDDDEGFYNYDFVNGSLQEELEGLLNVNKRKTDPFGDLERFNIFFERLEAAVATPTDSDTDYDSEVLSELSIHGINLQTDTLEKDEATSLVTDIGYDTDGMYSLDGATDGSNFNINMLSEEDIIESLGLSGGRAELSRILIDGVISRKQMIRSNIRLVQSIARTWFARASLTSGRNESHNKRQYYGSWSTPSMEDVIQEGIFGLAKAVERFEPERNFKFSTYATYYVTNEIRKCFQRSNTGCLYVPPGWFLFRAQYQKLVKKHYLETGDAMDIDVAAKEMGMKPDKLFTIIRLTAPLVQLDAPIPDRSASMTFTDGQTLGDSLESLDPSAEAKIEQSLLRQCLENALAAELSPHERDVLRLRHGLDDGISRSVREVVDSCGGRISPSDVRSTEHKAYSKLRLSGSRHSVRLIDFASEYVSEFSGWDSSEQSERI